VRIILNLDNAYEIDAAIAALNRAVFERWKYPGFANLKLDRPGDMVGMDGRGLKFLVTYRKSGYTVSRNGY
jgi:hypothetical protein